MARPGVGIGLIGYAFMGKAHSNAYRQVERFFDLPAILVMSALCGRDQAKVQSAAMRLGWESYETDYFRTIERDDIDIVDIATPGDQHLPMALVAAAAGKTVICEKPLGNNLAEAKLMVDAVERAGVVNMVCFNYRRVPAVALAKRMIDDGALGRIYHFRARYLQDWIVDPEFPLVWRLQRETAGSGALGDLGAHITDLAHYLVGSITEVAGATETFVKERPLQAGAVAVGEVTVDDAAVWVGRFANGAMGSFEATRFAPGRRNHNSFEINGSLGSISFNLERMNELEYFSSNDHDDRQGFRTINLNEGSQPYADIYWPPGHIIGYEHSFINTVADLIKAHVSGVQPHPSFREGAQVNAVLDAVERAAASKKWETVELLT